MKQCLIDPSNLVQFDFGPQHPFKIYRLSLAYNLMRSYDLIGGADIYTLTPRQATEDEALTFHSPGYLEILRLANDGMHVPNMFQHGLSTGDNPVFPGVYEWAMGVAGASIRCAEELIAGDAHVAFNISGGLHHAMPARASGFCHINDAVLAINKMLESDKRVAYVDIDAHHGDGVQQGFYQTDQVLTISIHQSGYTLFPGTGFVQEIGTDKGTGYSVNIPLLPSAGDDVYKKAFKEIILPLLRAYDADVLVTQLGGDAVVGDLVANLALSLNQFERLSGYFADLDKPWLALGGGGYSIENVVRAWTLAWSTMNGIILDNNIPANWQKKATSYNVEASLLRGTNQLTSSSTSVLNDLEQTISTLRETVFPIVCQSN